MDRAEELGCSTLRTFRRLLVPEPASLPPLPHGRLVAGELCQVAPSTILPKPVRRPPVLLGGDAPAALLGPPDADPADALRGALTVLTALAPG